MKNRTCLWCRKSSLETSFVKDAHIIPQSLGGKILSNNECDECNEYFGNYDNNKPSIDSVFKETFNLTRYLSLYSTNRHFKLHNFKRFKSVYFQLSKKNKSITLKPAFRVKKDFQNILCRQFKRGLFKVFLESYHEETGKGFSSEFDFIRKFSRFNSGDYPVLYFNRKYGVVATIQDCIQHPFLMKQDETDEIMNKFNFYEFEIVNHLFSIPTHEFYNENINKYVDDVKIRKFNLFNSIVELKQLNQIDLAMRIMNN